jgi:hypothetical protein
VLQGLDRAGGLAQDVRDLRGGQPGHPQHQYLALVGRELLQGGPHPGALEAVEGQLW